MPGGVLFYYDSEGSADFENSADSRGSAALGKASPKSADSEGGADSESSASRKPTVALIHGLGDEADTWRHVFPLLAGAGYRVLAPDLPGFGRSAWKGRISMRAHCGAVLRLLEFACADRTAASTAQIAAAGAERQVALVGSSLGAGIAELVACRRPDLAKALILVAGCFPFAKSAGKKLWLLGLPFLGKKWYRGFRANHEAAWKSLHSYYADLEGMSGEDRGFLRERVVARVESPEQERGYLSTVRSMNGFLMFGRRYMARKAKKMPAGILLLCGEKDRVFPPEKTGLFRALRPDAEFAVISGAGHLPQQERPEACAEKMLQFLSKLRC